jgi:predicted CXXCH cytochrome family protein
MRRLAWVIPTVLCILLGCSPAARQRVKHFFFEIPEEQPAQASTEGGTAEPAESALPTAPTPEPRFVSIHPPYAQHQCTACHNPGAKMEVRDDPAKWCAACHPRFFSDEVEHDPVASGDCTMCHQLHRSTHPHLLRDAVHTLCAECHGEADELGGDVHSGPDANECAKCHNPHFGSPPFLQPGYAKEKN